MLARVCLLVCSRSAKVGLLKTLRLILRCAVRHFLPLFCRKQDKGSVHDTQCINRLGWFAVGLFKRVGLFCARVFLGIHMMRGE